MSDFDKFLRDQLGGEEEQFPRKAENWEKLSERLDGVGIQGQGGNTLRLLHSALRRWAVAASIVSLLALNGWAMWQWQQAIRENTALQKTILQHLNTQPTTQYTATVPLQTPIPVTTPSITTPDVKSAVTITNTPSLPLTSVKPVATERSTANPLLPTAATKSIENTSSRPLTGVKPVATERSTANSSLNTPVATEQITANSQFTIHNSQFNTPGAAERSTDQSSNHSSLKEKNVSFLSWLPQRDIKPIATRNTPFIIYPSSLATTPVIEKRPPARYPSLALAVSGVLGQNTDKKQGIGKAKGGGLEVEFRPIRNLGVYGSLSSTHQSFEVEAKPWQPSLPPRPGHLNNDFRHPITRSNGRISEIPVPIWHNYESAKIKGGVRQRSVNVGARWIVSTKTWIQPTVSVGHTWSSWVPETAVITYKDTRTGKLLERSGITEKTNRDNLWHAGISLEKPTRYGTFFAAATYVKDFGEQSDENNDDRVPTMAMINVGVRLRVF